MGKRTHAVTTSPHTALAISVTSQDAFDFKNKQNLVKVDHYSDFYELDKQINIHMHFTPHQGLLCVKECSSVLSHRRRPALHLKGIQEFSQ